MLKPVARLCGLGLAQLEWVGAASAAAYKAVEYAVGVETFQGAAWLRLNLPAALLPSVQNPPPLDTIKKWESWRLGSLTVEERFRV